MRNDWRHRLALANAWCRFNAPYLSAILVSCALLADGSPIVSLVSLGFVSVTGYMFHRIAHTMKYTIEFECLSTCPVLGGLWRPLLAHLDFHSDVHHDERVAHTVKNTLIELYQNLIAQGLLQIAINALLLANALNNRVMVFWSLLYTSGHLVNQPMVSDSAHTRHHKTPNKNFEPYIYDLLFDTYSDTDTITTNMMYNYAVVNMAIITTVLLRFKKKLT